MLPLLLEEEALVAEVLLAPVLPDEDEVLAAELEVDVVAALAELEVATPLELEAV